MSDWVLHIVALIVLGVGVVLLIWA